jgi:hypothetical protein
MLCRTAFILVLIISVFSCSDSDSGNYSDVYSYPPIDSSSDSNGTGDPDAPDYGDVPVSPCDEVCEYQQECWDCSYYFCPPLDAVWQKRLCFDRCVDPPVLVVEGECVEYMECDPSNYIMGSEPCVTDEGYPGEATVYCNKGHIQTGKCSSDCKEEECNGLDDDCDGVVDEGFEDIEEICNNIDDNCNGLIDENLTGPCENECGPGEFICIAGEEICFGPDPEEEICNGLDDDCDGEIDEGQLNACGSCGDTPDDICDGVDNDCDGDTDEDLIQACSTVCEDGYKLCLGGSWAPCSAQEPMEEVCNGLDDDCDTFIDEGLDCQCAPDTVGFLIPCMEEPLVCGQGYKTCQCSDDICSSTKMSPCYAVCYWMPQLDPNCDPTGGLPTSEVCNNFDDDCDGDIDEGLVSACYSGTPETLDIGICHAGEMICETGKWGNYPSGTTIFIEEYCLDEQLPLKEDLCSGQDDDCDGIIDKEIEETDILFIVDTSGSMSNTISAVQAAMSMFASTYSDEEVIQWGLIIGPINDGWEESLKIDTALVPFQQFLPHLASVGASYATGSEMLYDAIYLSLLGLVDPANVLMVPQHWNSGITSTPSIQGFGMNWREDANHVIIVFTDEPGQSYLNPKVQKELIKDTAVGLEDLFIYTFSAFSGKSDWASVAIGGSWFELTSSPVQMFDNLMQILDETACGESAP